MPFNRRIDHHARIPVVIALLKANKSCGAYPVAIKVIRIQIIAERRTPRVLSKGIERGIIQSRHHFHLIFFGTFHHHGPRFFCAGLQLAAHGFKFHP